MQARAIIRRDGAAATSGITTSVPWWSFSKTVLSIALLRLSERGSIRLDVALEGKPFTPAQLLRHEAGLPDYGELEAYQADVAAGRAPWTTEELWTFTDADRLRYPPGKGWAYSNIGYFLVAELVQRASDRPLGDAMDELVFKPSDVATARLATLPLDLANVAMGDAVNYHPGWVFHGLVVGAALDAARIAQALLTGKLLRPRTFARMCEALPLPQFRSERYVDPAYGLGLMLQAKAPLDGPIGHSGIGPGSQIAVYGRGGCVCTVWATSSSGVDPVREALCVVNDCNR